MAKRSVRIAKGVRLNFNKTGTSLSFSHKGLLGGSHSKTVKLTGGSTKASRTSGARLQGRYDFKINDDGTAIFYDSQGNRVYDESLIRKMKATDQFREQKNRILAERKLKKQQDYAEEQDVKFKEIQGETESIISIHTLSPRVVSEADYLKAISNVRQREYKKEEFSSPFPTKDNALILLRNEAETNVNAPFWKRKKMIEAYIGENIDEFYNRKIADYEERKKHFEEEEERKFVQMNKKYAEEAEERRNDLRRYLNDDEQYIENALTVWLENITLTVDFNVEFEYKPNDGLMVLDLDLPQIDEMPKDKAVKLSSGTVKAKPKTQKEIKQDYILCVFSLALFMSSNIFNISTAIKSIIVSGFSEQRDDRTGNIIKNCLFSVRCLRDEFEITDITLRDPQQFCLSLENHCNITASLLMKPVEPLS